MGRLTRKCLKPAWVGLSGAPVGTGEGRASAPWRLLRRRERRFFPPHSPVMAGTSVLSPTPGQAAGGHWACVAWAGRLEIKHPFPHLLNLP